MKLEVCFLFFFFPFPMCLNCAFQPGRDFFFVFLGIFFLTWIFTVMMKMGKDLKGRRSSVI